MIIICLCLTAITLYAMHFAKSVIKGLPLDLTQLTVTSLNRRAQTVKGAKELAQLRLQSSAHPDCVRSEKDQIRDCELELDAIEKELEIRAIRQLRD